MNIPSDLLYTKDHEWISAKTGSATVGISSYAIEQLGDVVHIELPQVGDEITQGSSFGTIESTKTVSDLYLPGSGKIIAVNDAISQNPESLCQDPYQKGWLVKIKLEKDLDQEIMNADEYTSYTQEG